MVKWCLSHIPIFPPLCPWCWSQCHPRAERPCPRDQMTKILGPPVPTPPHLYWDVIDIRFFSLDPSVGWGWRHLSSPLSLGLPSCRRGIKGQTLIIERMLMINHWILAMRKWGPVRLRCFCEAKIRWLEDALKTETCSSNVKVVCMPVLWLCWCV